jgi:phospholipid/cholesterol/gamma-HCH transport system substrate-binding protein
MIKLKREISNETKVGILVFFTLCIAALFFWFLGAKNPFKSTISFYVSYDFAGGIEIGSPVRVAGIKVGKVEKIYFYNPDEGTFAGQKTKPDEIITPLKIKISVNKEAAYSVRRDSQFFINIAGIIGERYIEILPGTKGSPQIQEGDIIRGIDPPRIDQLISQSFDLAGKIKEVIENNEGDITKSIKLLYELSANINKTVSQIEKSKIFQSNLQELIQNLIDITRDVKALTSKTQTKEGKQTLELLYKLLWRLEPLDKEAISKFLQKEGIRARIL